MIPAWSTTVTEVDALQLPLPEAHRIVYADNPKGTASNLLTKVFGTPTVVFTTSYRVLRVEILINEIHELGLVDRIE